MSLVNRLYLEIPTKLYEILISKACDLNMTVNQYCELVLNSRALELEKSEWWQSKKEDAEK